MSLRQRLLLIVATVMLLLAFGLALLFMEQTAEDRRNGIALREEASQQVADRIAEQCFTADGPDFDRFYALADVALTAESALDRLVLLDMDHRMLYEAEPGTAVGHTTLLAPDFQMPPFGDQPSEKMVNRLGYSFAVTPQVASARGDRFVLLARIRPPRSQDIESTLFWIVMTVVAGSVVMIGLIYLAIWRLVLHPVERLADEVDRITDEERTAQARAAEVTATAPPPATATATANKGSAASPATDMLAAQVDPKSLPGAPVSPSTSAAGAMIPSGENDSRPTPPPGQSNTWLELERLQAELIKTRTPPPARGNEIKRLNAAFDTMVKELREHRADLHAQIEKVVAERAQAQARWIAAERLNATGRLAAGVAHEVNNPLGGIRNALRTIRAKEQARPDRDRRTLEYLDLADDGLARIGNIVNDLLGFSRRSSKPEPVDLIETAVTSQRLLAHRFRDAQTEFLLENQAGGPVLIIGERAKLGQIFLNLFGNALDAILERNADPAGRKVTLHVRTSGERVTLRIRDTGRGMSLEAQAHVTELFFTTKDPGKGTGLGLAVVATIVADLGGQLNFESSSEGACVSVVLPLRAGSAGA
ncbi:MAG: sensor histidine kinase [Planctomycetota bacterium]